MPPLLPYILPAASPAGVSCPKCNQNGVRFSYHDGNADDETCPPVEHMHRTCVVCGFSWREKVKNP